MSLASLHWHHHRLASRSILSEGGAQAAAIEKSYTPPHEEIARLAYSYWEARHGVGGSAGEDWLRAERDLLRHKRR